MRSSKWLVFIRPALAGFDRPLTAPVLSGSRFGSVGFLSVSYCLILLSYDDVLA